MLEITLSGPVLIIKGERKAEEEIKEEHYLRHEAHYGSFLRRIALPESANLEKPEATLADGVLTIIFPKRTAPQLLRIEVAPEAVTA